MEILQLVGVAHAFRQIGHFSRVGFCAATVVTLLRSGYQQAYGRKRKVESVGTCELCPCLARRTGWDGVRCAYRPSGMVFDCSPAAGEVGGLLAGSVAVHDSVIPMPPFVDAFFLSNAFLSLQVYGLGCRLVGHHVRGTRHRGTRHRGVWLSVWLCFALSGRAEMDRLGSYWSSDCEAVVWHSKESTDKNTNTQKKNVLQLLF